MKIKRNKIIFLGILTILLISGVIFLIKFPLKNMDDNYSKITIVGGADGPTAIYTNVPNVTYIGASLYDLPFILISSLLLIILNILILTVMNIIEHKKTKKIKLVYKVIIIFAINIIGSILFLPTVALFSIILSFIIIIALCIKNKMDKKKNEKIY
ncbi:hypothetical protein FACS1894110_15690 [Spirochaetia bacterium]|nr:hypothetical protein FACS1894110_15690 [Spirochaetia bacterium]